MRWHSWTETSHKEVAGLFCSWTLIGTRVTSSWCQWEKQFDPFSVLGSYSFLTFGLCAAGRQLEIAVLTCLDCLILELGAGFTGDRRAPTSREWNIPSPGRAVTGERSERWASLPYSEFLAKSMTQISLTSNGCFQQACQRHGAGEGQAEFSLKCSACSGLSDLDL